MPTLLPKLSMNAIRESYIDADLKGQFYRSKRPRGKPNEFALEKPRFGSGAEKRLKDRKKKKDVDCDNRYVHSAASDEKGRGKTVRVLLSV